MHKKINVDWNQCNLIIVAGIYTILQFNKKNIKSGSKKSMWFPHHCNDYSSVLFCLRDLLLLKSLSDSCF
jgi:hypothetical protein